MDGIIVLVVVVLVLFGSTQIPKLARSLGSAQKEFKKGVQEGASEDAVPVHLTVPAGTPAASVPPAGAVVVHSNPDQLAADSPA
jgi:sec-independent protein translocase protein TatA